MAIGGGKNKSKTNSSQTQQFNQNTSMTPRAYEAVTGRMRDLEQQEYQKLDPSAYLDYLNPFQDEVIDATTADINANRDRAATGQQAEIAAAGAFGDKRRGIYEAELDGQYDRTLATTLAGLRSRGYSDAVGIAQGENTNRTAFDANTQMQINQLLSLLADEKTTSGTSSGTAKGSQTGYNMGFSWSPAKGFNA